MTTPSTVTFMTFESFSDAYDQRSYDMPVLPSIPEPFKDILHRLGPDDANCVSCQASVGSYLTVDPTTDNERPVWGWLTIVHNVATGKHWYLCEDCCGAVEGPVPEVNT
jgi:hypothetical protein